MDKMDIDPIDDGPREVSKAPPLAVTPSSTALTSGGSTAGPMHVSEEEEARQAIDMLRGDDVSGRVAAANRLEAVASALGAERTREVRFFLEAKSLACCIHLVLFVELFRILMIVQTYSVLPRSNCGTGIATVLN